MASYQELIEQLKHDVQGWNQWRQEHPEIRPNLSSYANLNGAGLAFADLTGAILRGAHLGGADLTGATLRGAHLFNANLRGAHLYRASFVDADLSNAHLSFADLRSTTLSNATLSGADLDGTDLRDATLRDAHLNGAHLNGADLSGAGLRRADLSSADLSSANFNDTHFSRTHFAWVDLNLVKELETAIHEGPSVVDINSVTLPHDEPTRLHFLLGVGFTETQIEYLPALLVPRPIQYYSLFISYAHQDETVAQRLHTDLRRNDVPCWFAPHDLRIGDKIRHRIDESIHLHEKLLLILSEHSVASQWVEHEVETALSKERERKSNMLFPIRLDNAVLKNTTGWASHTRLTRHIGDFTNWKDDTAYQQAFSRLLRDLKVTQPPIP